MSGGPTLSILQKAYVEGKYLVRLSLKRPGQPELQAEATIAFALTAQEQEDLRWYFEDYLLKADVVEEVQVEQIERFMKLRGVELYEKMLEGSRDVRRLFDRVLDELPDLRVEINAEIVEAASIPWELMREPQSDSPLAVRVKSFVRVQHNPNLSFVPIPEVADSRVRLLYVVCRPGGAGDVPLRAIANRLLRDLGTHLARFEITALRPPTFEQLQKELLDAKEDGRPYQIVHFDGHGIYADLSKTALAGWLTQLSSIMLGAKNVGKRGYLIFEHSTSEEKMRPVSGYELGKLLHDTAVPVLILNACQSAMHEAAEKPETAATVHDEVRAIGSLAQAVVDQGIPAVLGMRYSIFVVTAAQYIGELYASLAKGRGFGQAATDGRKHLHLNPDRWIGLQQLPLQDWYVPIVYEATPLRLVTPDKPFQVYEEPEMDPMQINTALLRYVPDTGFVGRDEILLMLDRAFDDHNVVLLHAYAGQGKTATAVEFARWYARTGGLGSNPVVLLTSFEHYSDLAKVLDQIGQPFAEILQTNAIEWHALNDPGERRKLVLQILRQIPVLWIWDNVESLAGVPEGTESAWTVAEQAEFAGFLKQIKLDDATRAKILLTSRRDEQKWLGAIPHRVQMPPMSPEDAASLALKLGEEKGLTRAEIADWRPLLDYCAGNPLTLRVISGQAVKMSLRGKEQMEQFVQALCDGEQLIEDPEETQGRDKSLAASLDYGFRTAFKDDELPIIALLHLFQGTVNVDAIESMGRTGDHALPEVQRKSKEQLVKLLELAKDIGLLTHLGSTWYSVHPALPWFLRQLFEENYEGQDGRSSAEAAFRAWVEVFGAMSNSYHLQSIEGSQDVIQVLALEEANLLHARRLARVHGWWRQVISAMQGLDELYEYQGRVAEWARLVTEIVPDYCTGDDKPVSGREDDYAVVMQYRVGLARKHAYDLSRAAALQENVVAWIRQEAAAALALSEDTPLDDIQRHRIRTLAATVGTLGQILRDQGSSDCIKQYEESIRWSRSVKDVALEAVSHFNLGEAYLELPDIRNLDASEAAYRTALALYHPDDAVSRSKCMKQIGMVHHYRFREALKLGESPETLQRHVNAAEQQYQQALILRSASASAQLVPMHNQLGVFYSETGQTERAREHYGECLQICQQTGDRLVAGKARCNMAFTYVLDAKREATPARQLDALLRGQAYVRAALRDFQHYQGRAADLEAKAQQLLGKIEEELAKLPH
ncbi:MAG: CHAT domain-containing protein [Desulfomonilaceae bacterium]